MRRTLLLALAGICTLAFTGCNGAYYGSSTYVEGGYGGGGGYYEDEPYVVQYDQIYIDNDYRRVPIYAYRDDVYYVYGGRKHYFSGNDRYRYNDSIERYRRSKNYRGNNNYQDDYRYRQQVAENKVKTNQYRLEQEAKQKQARYEYSNQRNQYAAQQKVAENRAQVQRNYYSAQQDQARKQAEYNQKVAQNRAQIQRSSMQVQQNQARQQAQYNAKAAEYRQKQAVAEYKAKNASKKKKKDDD